MATQNDDSKPERIDTEQATSEVFKLLSDHRRRIALHYLARHTGPVSVSDVADQIARFEEDHTVEHHKRICTSLVHTHIPKLADAGIVRYDPDRDVVELVDQPTGILPVLELTTVD